MSLGEQINELRTQRRMSQGDLAEQLGVSRQSISKWETDTSVPELEKLVKLAQLFEVSLDELVTGEPPVGQESPATGQADTWGGLELGSGPVCEKVPAAPRGWKTGVIILFCMAFLVTLFFTVMGSLVVGLIFSLPFLVCALICLWAKKHPVLWCLWALFLMADAYLRYTTGLNWSVVWMTFLWETSWNYTRLVIGWCQLLCALALAVGTAIRLKKDGAMEWTKRNKALFIGGVALFVLLSLPVTHGLWQWDGLGVAGLVTFLGYLCDSVRLALLAGLFTALLRGRKRAGDSAD